MKTRATKASEIKKDWYLIDAQGEILGRLATKIAGLLIGKHKPYFVPHLNCGDYVVVLNAAQIKVTGRKREQKLYYRHSGYPGGFKAVSFEQQMAKDPRKIIIHAVSGMLPKNKLRAKRIRQLKVFVDEKHPYQDKKPIIEDKKE